jgi:hypothetical protein
MDYSVGAILTASPAFLPHDFRMARKMMVSAGLGATIYSLFTNYEMGAIKKLPMKTHLKLDIMSGLLLMTAPLFMIIKKEEKKALIFTGMVELCAGLFSKEN